jgi:putative acetyltransferase
VLSANGLRYEPRVQKHEERMMTGLLLRPYTAEDAAPTLRVFERAIGETARSRYTEEQVRAWLGDPRDLEEWNADRLRVHTVVAETDGVVAGFTDLNDDGYVDRLFVSPDFARQGIGSRLLRYITGLARERGIATLTSHVSLVARPVFEAAGFEVVHSESVHRGDATLQRFFMRSAPPAQAATSGSIASLGIGRPSR